MLPQPIKVFFGLRLGKQWGYLSSITAWTNKTFTFPVSFSSFNIVVVGRLATNTTESNISITSKSLTQCTVMGDGANAAMVIVLGK